MAKTPTAMDIALPQVGGARPVAGYDVSAFGAGGQALARGGERLGQGIEQGAADIAAKQTEQLRQQADNAKTGFATDLLGLREKYQNDPDYTTVKQRWDGEAEALRQKYVSGFPSGPIRDHMEGSTGQLRASESLLSSEKAFKGASDASLAGISQSLSTAIQTYKRDPADANDPTHSALVSGIHSQIDNAVANNFITRERGELLKEKSAKAIADRHMSLWAQEDPQGFLEATGGWVPQAKIAKAQGTTEFLRSRGQGRAAGPGRVEALDRDFSGRLRTAIEDAEKATGQKAVVQDFKRTTQEQAEAYQRYRTGQGGLAAPPGSSRHEIGQAADIGDGPVQAWLHANAAKYGLEFLPGRAGQVDPGHIQLAGTKPQIVREAPAAGEQPAGGGHPLLGIVDPVDLIRHQTNARSVMQQRATDEVRLNTQASTDRAGQYALAIQDAHAGRGALPPLEMFRDDPLIKGTPHELALTKAWDEANKQDDAYNNFLVKYADPKSGPSNFNTLDKEDRKQLDKLFLNSGGGKEAFEAIVSKTGMVPSTGAAWMMGRITSNNIEDVMASANLARNLIAQRPQIFEGVENGPAIEKAAVKYRHLTEDLAYTPEQAARELMKDNTPEGRKARDEKIKNEDVEKLVKDNLSPSDIASHFKESWIPFFGKPSAGVNEGQKQAMFNDYAELFKKYWHDGDGTVSTAKDLALKHLDRIWGVTRFSGTSGGTVMRYPPEKSAAVKDIPNPGDAIAEDAVSSIKAGMGEDVTRDKVMLTPLPGGQTAAAYNFGESRVPYVLSWYDKQGHLQTAQQPFIVDHDHLAAQTKKTTLNPEEAADLIWQGGGIPLPDLGGKPMTEAEALAAREKKGAAYDTARARAMESGAVMAQNRANVMNIPAGLAAARGGQAPAAEGGALQAMPQAEAQPAAAPSDIDRQLADLDRREMALKRSGLGGAFLAAQSQRIARQRAELEAQRPTENAAR